MRTPLQCKDKKLDLSRPRVMGILNMTPDSFSDGGLFVGAEKIDLTKALEHARRMVAAGAAIIDVGGESTRPGAADISVEQELQRVIPVIEAIKAELDVIVSIDTSKPEVMTAAVAAGAGMINDIRALQQPGALAAASQAEVPVVLMHMLGEPGTMQADPRYVDMMRDIKAFLLRRIVACEAAGIPAERIIIDPGFGFGKTVRHNLELIKRLREFTDLGRPILMGVSRKSTIGTVLNNKPVEGRLIGSVILATVCAQSAANILRVHDVAETIEALTLWHAVNHPELY